MGTDEGEGRNVEVATSRVKISEDPRLETAQHRLHESVGPVDRVEAIREIVTGLLGCEEIALFTVDRGESELFWSFGIDPMRHKTLALERPALQRVLHGEIHIVSPVGVQRANPAHPSLRAFVPIRVSRRTVAVLVMLKLLPQKIAFDESDMRLLELLSNQAGRGLFGAGMESQPQAARRDG